MQEILNNKKINVLLYREDVYLRKDIKKKNKTKRTIYIPQPFMKQIQKQLYPKLQEKYLEELNQMCFQHAYIKGKGIKSNASAHVRKKYIIKLDVKNYFDSIHFGRIYHKLSKKLDNDSARKISQLACYRKNGKHVSLAQGAPLAPLISNLVSQYIDIYIYKWIKLTLGLNNNVCYTRYSDDLTFSTNDVKEYEIIKSEVDNLLFYNNFKEKTGFELNKDKTKIIKNGSRKVVTGVVVNKKTNVSKKYISELRGYLRNCNWDIDKTIKIYAEKNQIENLNLNKFEQIIKGKIEYIKTIKGGDDPTYIQYAKMFNKSSKFLKKIDLRGYKHIYSVKYDSTHGSFSLVKINNHVGVLTNYHVVEECIFPAENTATAYFSNACVTSINYNNDYAYTPTNKGIPATENYSDEFTGYQYDDSVYDYAFIPLEAFNKLFGVNLKKKDAIELKKKNCELRDEVEVIGFPNKPDELSVISGKVKKITSYEYILDTRVGQGGSGSLAFDSNNDVIGLYCEEEISGEENNNIQNFGARIKKINNIIDDLTKKINNTDDNFQD